ncbi:hypothetical protein LQZ19_17290 [Treponema primitia]|uniref:RCC1 domain-containing protein n=1 Tax=Treponema primitia TaxID=88058 RepID=UPI003980D3F8
MLATAFLVSALLTGCDLFLTKPENNLLSEIDDALDYANAATLNVRVAAAEARHGITTPNGQVAPKAGYPFTVLFTPNEAWQFRGWQIIAEGSPTPLESGCTITPLNESGTEAEIIISGNGSFVVQPLCGERPAEISHTPETITPRVDRNSMIQVRFNNPILKSTLEGRIEITVYPNYGGDAAAANSMEMFDLAALTLDAYPANESGSYLTIPVKKVSDVVQLTENSNINVRLLPGIQDTDGNELAKEISWTYGVNDNTDTEKPFTGVVEAVIAADVSTWPGTFFDAAYADDRRVLNPDTDFVWIVFYASDNSELTDVWISEKRQYDLNGNPVYDPTLLVSTYTFASLTESGYAASVDPLVHEYITNAHPDRELAYVVKHRLQTPAERTGIIELFVQVGDGAGNRDAVESAITKRFLVVKPGTLGMSETFNFDNVFAISEDAGLHITDSAGRQWFGPNSNTVKIAKGSTTLTSANVVTGFTHTEKPTLPWTIDAVAAVKWQLKINNWESSEYNFGAFPSGGFTAPVDFTNTGTGIRHTGNAGLNNAGAPLEVKIFTGIFGNPGYQESVINTGTMVYVDTEKPAQVLGFAGAVNGAWNDPTFNFDLQITWRGPQDMDSADLTYGVLTGTATPLYNLKGGAKTITPAVDDVYTIKVAVNDLVGNQSKTVTSRAYPPGFKNIAASGSNSMVVKDDGTLWVAGPNANGQLGLGIGHSATVFEQVPGMDHVKAVAAGDFHSLVLKDNGTLWAAGSMPGGSVMANEGQLGSTPTPTFASVTTGVKAIAAGTLYSMVLLDNGTVKTTGHNAYGELGSGDSASPNFPSKTTFTTVVRNSSVSSDTVWAISAGDHHSLISTGYRLYGAGYDADYRIGANSGYNFNEFMDSEYGEEFHALSLAAGFQGTMVLTNNGSLKVSGTNSNGQFGLGYPIDAVEGTTPISSVKRVFVSGSSDISFLIKSNAIAGTLMVAGTNDSGSLGLGFPGGNIVTFTEVKDPEDNVLNNVISAGVGTMHSLIVKDDGTLWGAGYNTSGPGPRPRPVGALGTGDSKDHFYFTQVPGFSMWTVTP